ncbi:hypothetical protein ABZ601_34075 [Streptomyces sp. NPDC012842]|uniref:hypothetical protein n=1 Tax=Streptomyces TaxID=1883 RepID=UPI0033F6709B
MLLTEKVTPSLRIQPETTRGPRSIPGGSAWAEQAFYQRFLTAKQHFEACVRGKWGDVISMKKTEQAL